MYLTIVAEKRAFMSVSIRISAVLAKKAKSRSPAMHRSLVDQIEFWVKKRVILKENPDLSFRIVQDILIRRELANNLKLIPYQFSKKYKD